MGMGQYNSLLGEYCDPHTASVVFPFFFTTPQYQYFGVLLSIYTS